MKTGLIATEVARYAFEAARIYQIALDAGMVTIGVSLSPCCSNAEGDLKTGSDFTDTEFGEGVATADICLFRTFPDGRVYIGKDRNKIPACKGRLARNMEACRINYMAKINEYVRVCDLDRDGAFAAVEACHVYVSGNLHSLLIIGVSGGEEWIDAHFCAMEALECAQAHIINSGMLGDNVGFSFPNNKY